MEAFKVCHTSRKKGMSDVAREAVAPLPSVEVVSKVLSQNSSNSTFLKNAGLSTPSSKSSLAYEVTLPILHEHLEELKKKTEATEDMLQRTASLFDELKKQEEESHLMLQKL
ncbi:hypothetical protein PVAP13_8KG206701 [Panicum virgatum]|uniref:Uncharacterized protein n=1 Tax=Panicum virgatum TaxID=38727 RepID=A0A8T0PPU3_PANVG|nr:hypothetical protein PVAP13_8KG206701 [Panicum virgatum]